MLIQAVVFDLDDTLYPERQFAFSGFAAVAEAFGDVLGDCDRAAADMRKLFDSPSRARVFDALLAQRGRATDAAIVGRMVEVYRNHRPTISVYEDVSPTLQRLRAGGVHVGLITDGPSATQRNKIASLRLSAMLDQIIVTSELIPPSPKPSLAAFEQMARLFGVPPEACVYVADNPAKDFVAPRALGWTPVQIAREEGIYRAVSPAAHGMATHRITLLRELWSIPDLPKPRG